MELNWAELKSIIKKWIAFFVDPYSLNKVFWGKDIYQKADAFKMQYLLSLIFQPKTENTGASEHKTNIELDLHLAKMFSELCCIQE